MFKKLLLKILSKQKLTPEEKEQVRKLTEDTPVVDEVKSEQAGEETEKENETMSEENKNPENGANAPQTEDNKANNQPVTQPTVPAPAPQPEQSMPSKVEETQSTGNGIPIEELVTKEELHAQFAAFEAKYSALTKENEDLKAKLSDAESVRDGLKAKYEDKDFGNNASKGVSQAEQRSNQSFEEYSREFMGKRAS